MVVNVKKIKFIYVRKRKKKADIDENIQTFLRIYLRKKIRKNPMQREKTTRKIEN